MMPEDTVTLYLRLAEALIQDYRSLVSETRRKFASIKDAAEKQIAWVRTQMNGNEDLKKAFIHNNKLLLEPFLNGCLTKQQKIVILSITAIQKLITNSCLSEEGAGAVVGILWNLMSSNIEEVRVLQTTILLLTSSTLVKDSLLSKAFTLCIRLHASKTPATVNTAAAAVRQCASTIFDRVLKDTATSQEQSTGMKSDSLLRPEDVLPVNVDDLSPAAKDAYRLFQDICALLGDEPLTWLTGISEFSRALGLELIESVVLHYSSLFRQSVAFAHLLKTNLCPLVIKLFSPSLKLRSTPTGTSPAPVESVNTAASSLGQLSGSGVQTNTISTTGISSMSGSEKVSFPILVRLKRLITVIVEQYFHLLNTECEIYLSLLIRFLDVDKIAWERALALEVLYKFSMQPEIIRHTCISYDMRPHSTKIFQEWINTLSHYVQLVLASPSTGDELTRDSNPASVAAHQPGPNQSLLYYKGVFFPIVQPKSLLLDLLDRAEPPALVDGYCLSMAVACIMRTVQSLEAIVSGSGTVDSTVEGEPKSSEVNEHLVSQSWCGCLSALALLLEASADEKVTSNLLQALHTMVGLTGQLHADVALDAFITTMCRASLPSSYARSLFTKNTSISPSSGAQLHEEAFERSPVVIVVTQGAGHSITVTPTGVSSTGSSIQIGPSSSSSSGVTMHTSSVSTSSSDPNHHYPNGSLLITAKHLQVAKAVLLAAQAHGNVLGRSWNIILTTIQNLVWMLGLKVEPAAELYFKPTPNNIGNASNPDVSIATVSGSNAPSGVAVVASAVSGARPPLLSASSAVTTDLNRLSNGLSALFMQSSQLNVNALNDLILGLTQLSSEAMEAASVNKDPSPFAIAKLTEVGLVNVHRLQLWWDNVCCQLLSMCKLSHTGLRQMAANALIVLIKQAIAAPQEPPFWKNEALTSTVLDPLSALSEVGYDDVREKQLDCVQHMLHCWGEQIGASWLRVIHIVGVIRESYKVDLILTAFQCFKLIVTDYLSSLAPGCYAACVVTAARFGHQKQDLNIALTAIGHILHLADYLLSKDSLSYDPPESASVEHLALEELWISIFRHLADLCLDRRPAIRKSACQTLFNTVECHGNRFDAVTWSSMFWKVLFPLLGNVHHLFISAPVEREGRTNSLLIHHSRDTAAKQWAETVVLTLSGVSHLIVSKQRQLLVLDEFPKVWTTLLEQLRQHALTSSAEISVTALSALQTLLELKSDDPHVNAMLWPIVWETWLQIGTLAVHFETSEPTRTTFSPTEANESKLSADDPCMGNAPRGPFVPTASFMTLMFDLFVPLFSRCINSSQEILTSDWTRLTDVFRLGLLAPIFVTHLYPQSNVTLLPLVDDGTLSPLQESVLRDVKFLIQAMGKVDDPLSAHLPTVLQLLLDLAGYTVHIPKPRLTPEFVISTSERLETAPLNYIVCAEKCLQTAVDTYMATMDWTGLSHRDLLQAVVQTLHKPMALKYACPSQSTWMLACKCFLQVMPTTVPILTSSKQTKAEQDHDTLCTVIADTFQDFLFYQHRPPSSLSVEEFQQHEELDCKFVRVISDLFLSSSTKLPDAFVSRLINLLSWGSVQASAPTLQDPACTSPAINDNILPESPLSPSNRTEHPYCNGQTSSSVGKRTPLKGLGMAVRQTDPLVSHDPLTDGALSLDLDLDRLRQFAFRENFARLCFSTLLCHAFSRDSGLSSMNGPSTTRIENSSHTPATVSVAVSRCAIRSILQRCRLTLVRFYQAASLTGKCPLPRARLSELAYVFKALTVMLTSLRSVCAQRDVDPSTWHHVIDLYPHIVDCVLVTGGSQMTVALHRLLRLYGDLLRPACVDSPKDITGSLNTVQ